MNHIYKVIWNRARACWQVVSELAKGNGKLKSSRRQNRLGNALPLPALREYKKLAAALTVVLGCSLSGVAYAAEGETTADGLLSYRHNNAEVSDQNIFKGWQDGKVLQPGNSYNTVVLRTSAPKVVNPDNGSELLFNKNSFDTIVNYYNSSAGGSKNYDTIIAVIYVPDPSNPGATTPKTYKVYTASEGLLITFANLVNPARIGTIGSDYWCTPEIAQQIYQAEQAVQSSDPAIKAAGEAKLMQLISNGLPHLYTAQGDDWQNGKMLTLGTSTSPFKFGSRTTSLSSSPLDSTYSYSYQSPTVGEGGVWRPMDRLESTRSIVGSYNIGEGWVINADGTVTQVGTTTTPISNGSDSGRVVSSATAITVKDLTVGKNGTIDLSYINTAGIDPLVNHITGGSYSWQVDGSRYSRAVYRTLLVQNASLADGSVFRLGSYSVIEDMGSGQGGVNENTKVYTIDGSKQDQVFITNATAPDGHSNLYIELGWVPGVGTTNQGAAVSQESNLAKPVLLGILEGADQFTVTGRTSLADGIFSQYEITPVIGKIDNYFTDPTDSSLSTGTAWTLDSYSYVDLDTASESGRSASDNKVVLNNLWKSNYLNMFRRVGSLHRQGFTERHVELTADNSPAVAGQDNSGSTSRTLGIAEYPVEVPDQKENVWAEVWHGKYKSSAAYGREVDQTYNGMQVGYDKLLNKDLYNGKVYTGFYLSKVEGDSHTATGGGEQNSEGLGLYGAWVGDKGHYLDVALMASRLSNDYHLTGNTGSGLGRVTGDYTTWSYGLGLQYGYRSPVNNGWFWEPSATLFAGHVNGAGYTLSNNLGVRQDSYDTVTGRLGLTVGKKLAEGRGNVYAGIAALHEFTGTGAIGSSFNGQQRLLEPGSGKDTWWEFNLGGNLRISPTGAFNLDFSKTAGSDNGRDWKINGGLNWTWGGFWGGGNSTDKAKALDLADPERTNSALVVGQHPAAVASPAVTAVQPGLAAGQPLPAGEAAPAMKADATVINEAATVTVTPPVGNNQALQLHSETAYTATGDGETMPPNSATGEFAFAPVTVEASRPDWEKKLSPGQVSVIYPEKFEGEQKDLPALLERVPGLFVQRVSGDGHYTVARVRGATGAQVHVYVDGVLMNLNGEAAVNLSTIPVDNVERVEVYRGYVPARFSGSPLGGVINVVTKKPDKVGGTISQGMKSYGGYTGSYQLTAPVGDGSLLATYQRDIWDGDFPFTIQPNNRYGHEFGDTHRRSNGYQNSNGMVKWQNDNWTVKTAWKQLHEQLPRPVSRLSPDVSSSYNYEDYHKGRYDADQAIDQKEFQLGWRDTAGSLDWGWKLYYLDSEKDYRATGLLRAGETASNFTGYPGYLWSQFHSKKWGGNLNTAWKLDSSHLVEMNFDYSRETMDANGSNWDSFDDSMTHLNRQFIREYKIQEYHLTLQDTITLNQAGDFKLTPVLRADRVVMDTMADNDKKWQYSGAAALQKQLNEHWGVKTSWGTYNRHPNFYELFGDGATIRPNKAASRFFDVNGEGTWETGHQFDFSINWQGEMLKADTDTALTWFQRRSKNQFALWQPSVPNAPASYFPMDDARVHGLELTQAMNWDRLTLSLAGTWQKSKYSGNNMGGNYNGMKSHISYTPEWVYNARLDYRLPGDKLSLFTEYTYTGKQFLGADGGDSDGQFMAALSTVDLGLKYAFDKNWKLSAGVNDVFNKGYELRERHQSLMGNWYNGVYIAPSTSTLAYPLAGRVYYATMEYKF